VTAQVNGQDVTSDRHEGIVAKIKAKSDEVHLLVADAVTYEHFKRSDERPKSETELFIEVIGSRDDDAPEAGTTDLKHVYYVIKCVMTAQDISRSQISIPICSDNVSDK